MGADKLRRIVLLGAALGVMGLALWALLPAAPEPPAGPALSARGAAADGAAGRAAPVGPDGGVADAGPTAAQQADDAAGTPPSSGASLGMLTANLANGRSFRVRMRAALALGRMRGKVAGDALLAALSDPHPAVRAAAARSLGEGRHRRAKPALARLAKGDPEEPVRAAARASVARLGPPPAKASPGKPQAAAATGALHVRVGAPAAPSGGISGAMLGELKRAAELQLRGAPGVSLGASPGPAGRSFYLDLSVGAVEQTPQGVRASATVIIQTDPGRSMKASVTGKATVPGADADDERARSDALRGAVRSALRKVPDVLERIAQ